MVPLEKEEKEDPVKEDEEEDEDDEEENGGVEQDGTKKKKKKKKKRKKKRAPGVVSTDSVTTTGSKEPCQRPPHRGLLSTAFTDAHVKYGQTDPPTIPVAELFRDREYPIGEIQNYGLESQTYRETSEE